MDMKSTSTNTPQSLLNKVTQSWAHLCAEGEHLARVYERKSKKMADLAAKDCDNFKGKSSTSSKQGGNNEKTQTSKQIILEAMKLLASSTDKAGEEEEEYIEDVWDNSLVPELEQLLTSVIEATFQCAIKRIVRFGYTDHVAKWAVSRSGIFMGLKDTESNIVNNALAVLKNSENVREAEKGDMLMDLQDWATYTMLEMVSAAKIVRVDLSIAEAIWYLLIYDLNLSELCSGKIDLGMETNISGDDCKFKSSKENTREKNGLSEEELSEYSKNLDDPSYRRDVRDRLLLLLQMRKMNLEKEIGFWTKWANEKVKQATLTLMKDQTELKELRLQRAMEASMDKKLEQILANIKGQINMAKAELMSVEEEHKVLKKTTNDSKLELQTASDKATQAKIKGQELSEKIKELEKINRTLEQDLRKLKDGKEGIGQDLKKEQACLKQEEAKISEIEKGKEKLVKSAETLRSEREEMIAAEKIKRELAKREAADYEKELKEKEEKLEAQISELKIKVEMEKISQLRRSMSLSVSNKSEGSSGSNSLKRQSKYEYECVMCMNDERSVVFLPCCHQVLCVNCSELHEKRGLNECPTCRTKIAKRIAAIFVKP